MCLFVVRKKARGFPFGIEYIESIRTLLVIYVYKENTDIDQGSPSLKYPLHVCTSKCNTFGMLQSWVEHWT